MRPAGRSGRKKLALLALALAAWAPHQARRLFTWTGIAHQFVAAVAQRVTAGVNWMTGMGMSRGTTAIDA